MNKTDWPCVLVNNQAAAGHTPIMEVTAEQLDNEFSVNVFGVIYMTQAVVGIGQMPKGGRIINVGSIASKILVPSLVYTVTKAAQDALTTLLAGEVSLPWCSSPALLRRISNE